MTALSADAPATTRPAPDAPMPPRARGVVRVSARSPTAGSAPARLDRLFQQGSAKCLLPRGEAEMTAVLLNTAGGITGGDRFDWQATAGPGARLVVTTQAAERAYRARPGETGRVETRLTAGPGATLEWLAQETIFFDGAALERRVTADLAPDATLLLVEPVILGRQAMGETVRQGHFSDRWEIRVDGRLVRTEATRLSGPVAEIATGPGTLGGRRAFATVLLFGPDAERKLPVARAALPKEDAGASFVGGALTIRLAAADGAGLRSALKTLLAGLRDRPLPRVWTM